jgi:hypothetical protein
MGKETEGNCNGDRTKYNRDMLFGSKAKFVREIQLEELEAKSLV